MGDALGSQFDVPFPWEPPARRVPDPPWSWSDDTAMATAILRVIEARGEVDQDALADAFVECFDRDRGFGAGMVTLLRRLEAGEHWRDVSPNQFGGQGSYGNGSAMRVAPIGAWFADDPERVTKEAIFSSTVTHTHPDAVAGAIAIAQAAAILQADTDAPRGDDLIQAVWERLTMGDLADAVDGIRDVPADADHRDAARLLGNGAEVTAIDTVPLVLWLVSTSTGTFEVDLWRTIECGGDIDTTCAMVGALLVARDGIGAIPAPWLEATEPLPAIAEVLPPD